MGILNYFKRQPVQLKALTTEDANAIEQTASTGDRKDSEIFKAYIPEFLYKPPFGMPRKDNPVQYKQLAKNPYVFSVIKTLCDEATTTGWEIRVKEDFKDSGENYDEQIKTITRFLKNPNGNDESLQHILRQLITDLLETDSAVLVKVFNRGGEMKQIFARDGSLFLKNTDIYGYLGNRADFVLPVPDGFNGVAMDFGGTPTTTQQQIMKQYALLYKEQAAYFQYGWTAGSMPIPFGKREIIYMMQMPRGDNIYGTSPIGRLLEIILNLIYGADFNLDFYTNNNMPDGAIQLMGADNNQIKQFRENMENQFKFTDDLGNKRKRFYKHPITSTDVKFTPFTLNAKDMEVLAQQKWFTKILWMCFGVNADEMGFCYSADTRVLTNNGLKYYDEITSKDKIATVLDDKTIDYIKPSKIHTFDVKDRKFHKYKNKNVDLMVSDDHRIKYKTDKVDEWKMLPSNEINLSRVNFLQGGLKWKGKKIDKFKIKKIEYNNNKDKNRKQLTEFDMKDWCEFMGYYLSEGSVIKKANDRKQFAVKISQTKPEGVKIMKPLLTRLGFRREKTCWVLNNKSLATYLLQFGNSNFKYIPNELKNLDYDNLKILFDALIVGDGHTEKTGSVVYSTSSKRLSEDVLEIMLKLGYSAKIRKQIFDNKNWNDHYIIRGNFSNIEPYVNIKEHRKNEKYTGVMWCPSVKNRTFITERNGKIGIHYNTEDSNKSDGENQIKNFKRKAIKPLLDVVTYHLNTQLLNEFFDNAKPGDIPLEFAFDEYDVGEDIQKHNLFEQQIRMGIKTPMMVAKELGIDTAELESEMEKNKEEEQDGMVFENDLNNNNGDEKTVNQDDVDEKAMAHKYISKTGSAGKYVYTYQKKKEPKKINTTKIYSRDELKQQAEYSVTKNRETIDLALSKIPKNKAKKISNNWNKFVDNKDTLGNHTDKNGKFTKDRTQTVHKKIYTDYMKSIKTAAATGKPDVVFMAGIPGAGKTFSTKQIFDYSDDGKTARHKETGNTYVIINTDNIKTKLPEYDGGDGATLVHEESSTLSKMIMRLAIDGKANVIFDGTLSNSKSSLNKVEFFKNANYSTQAIYVDTDVPTAIYNAATRFKKSGRYAHYKMIAEAEPSVRNTINKLKDKFSKVQTIKSTRGDIDWNKI